MKACLIVDNARLLQCHRYVELDPLRDGMATDPRNYPWSSHRHDALSEHDPLTHPHLVCGSLAARTGQCLARYRAFWMGEVMPEKTDTIRLHAQRQRLYGSNRLQRAIEAPPGTTIGPCKMG